MSDGIVPVTVRRRWLVAVLVVLLALPVMAAGGARHVRASGASDRVFMVGDSLTWVGQSYLRDAIPAVDLSEGAWLVVTPTAMENYTLTRRDGSTETVNVNE